MKYISIKKCQINYNNFSHEFVFIFVNSDATKSQFNHDKFDQRNSSESWITVQFGNTPCQFHLARRSSRWTSRQVNGVSQLPHFIENSLIELFFVSFPRFNRFDNRRLHMSALVPFGVMLVLSTIIFIMIIFRRWPGLVSGIVAGCLTFISIYLLLLTLKEEVLVYE